MSQRYETYHGGAEIEIVPPGTALGDELTDDHSLVIGNPWSSALALTGGFDVIESFAREILAEVADARRTADVIDVEEVPTNALSASPHQPFATTPPPTYVDTPHDAAHRAIAAAQELR
ncbi:hypothetical protein [Catenuloplanes japonicus]|uniref:hypothetical protein n=1 Tax=Catenuloplanes japonicus TaxID=33876 RepID=UPI0005262724|nr:hypothetical protein [Catenuloplanes japonicus]